MIYCVCVIGNRYRNLHHSHSFHNTDKWHLSENLSVQFVLVRNLNHTTELCAIKTISWLHFNWLLYTHFHTRNYFLLGKKFALQIVMLQFALDQC